MIDRKWLHRLATAVGLGLLGLSAWYLYEVLSDVNWNAVGYQLTHTPVWRLTAAATLTLVGYLVIAGYDALGLRYVGHRFSAGRTLFAGMVSGAFSNSVAIPVLNVGGMRFRFYTAWGIPQGAIARQIVFVGLGSWLGLLLLAGTVFVIAPPRLPFAPDTASAVVRELGVTFLVGVAGYLAVCGGWRSVRLWKWHAPLPTWRLAVGQAAVGAADWLVQAMIVYVLLAGEGGVALWYFMGAYFAAMLAAMIGRSGGGFGIFEAGALFLLGPGMAEERLVTVLILYRIICHFSPLLLATAAYGLFEARRRVAARHGNGADEASRGTAPPDAEPSPTRREAPGAPRP